MTLTTPSGTPSGALWQAPGMPWNRWDCSSPPEGEIRRTIGMTLERSFTALTGSTDPAGQAEFSRLFNEKAEEVMVDSAVLYPGARELFDWLETQGIAAGVVTNKNRPRIAAILERAGISPAVLVSAQDAVPKPAPDGILLAARSCAFCRNRCSISGTASPMRRQPGQRGADSLP